MTQRRFLISLLLVILPATVLRAAGLFDDFWLDEIWSYNIATQIGNPLEVLCSDAARIDNNHPLNTLLMWMIGQHRNWFVYRIPSLLAGACTLVMVAVIMRRRGEKAGVLATALVAFSYPLIFYSSEARGYSLAVMFALIAFDALERFIARPSWAPNLLFVLASILGMLSHLSYVHVYVGFLACSVVRLSKDARSLLRLHVVPLATTAALYLGFVRNMTIGGSPPMPLWQALTDAVCGLVATRGPIGIEIALLVAIVAGFAWVLVSLRRSKSDWWILLLVALVISPAMAIARQNLLLPADKHQPISPRYFLVALPFLLMAAGWMCAKLGRRPSVIAALGIFFALSIGQTVQFLRVGRGHYSDAVLYMSAQTPGPVITVLADSAYRTGMPLDFYARVLPANQQLVVYRPQDGGPPAFDHGPPVWLIRHSNIIGSPPVQRYDVNDIDYRFEREFPYYGLSGYSWYLYRRSDS